MFKKYSDKEILEGIRLQDEKILNHLYSNFYGAIKSHVLRNSGTSEDASDLFQESIIILYKQVVANDLALTSDLKGYIFGIARNLWNAQLRRKSKSAELNFDIIEEDGGDIQNRELMRRIVQRSFIKLKSDCQQCLTLFLDGKSYEEMAREMELKSETYARRKKYLCKEALMEIIKSDPDYRDVDL